MSAPRSPTRQTLTHAQLLKQRNRDPLGDLASGVLSPEAFFVQWERTYAIAPNNNNNNSNSNSNNNNAFNNNAAAGWKALLECVRDKGRTCIDACRNIDGLETGAGLSADAAGGNLDGDGTNNVWREAMECVGKWTASVRDRANNTQQELSGALDAARLRLELQRAAAQAGAHGPTLHTNISRVVCGHLGCEHCLLYLHQDGRLVSADTRQQHPCIKPSAAWAAVEDPLTLHGTAAISAGDFERDNLINTTTATTLAGAICDADGSVLGVLQAVHKLDNREKVQHTAETGVDFGPHEHMLMQAAIAQLPAALRSLRGAQEALSALSDARTALRSRAHLAQLLRNLAAEPHGGGEEESRAETLRLCVAQATGAKMCVLWMVDAVGTLSGWMGKERVEAGEGVGTEVAEHVRRCEEEEEEGERERDGQHESEEEGNVGEFRVEGPRVMVNIRDEEECLCAVLECIYAHPSHFRRKEHLDVLHMAGELALAAARRAEHFAAATQTRVPPPLGHFGSVGSRAVEDPLL